MDHFCYNDLQAGLLEFEPNVMHFFCEGQIRSKHGDLYRKVSQEVQPEFRRDIAAELHALTKQLHLLMELE